MNELIGEPRLKRRSDENIFARHAFNIITLLFLVVTYFWNGSGWAFTRESKERELAAQVSALQSELDQIRSTYVRQDVFSVTMQSIDQRLASIDRKLSEKR